MCELNIYLDRYVLCNLPFKKKDDDDDDEFMF